jgi:regulator of protease activity HflC (stomatin/prohibitin superfamily)
MNIATLIQAIGSFAWIAVIGLFVAIATRVSRHQPVRGLTLTTIVLLVVAILLTSVGAGLVFLQADQYGVVISALQANGYRAEPLGPGLHWVVPFVENVRTYSIARQTYTMATTTGEGQVAGDDSIEARTKDGQQVYIDASVIYSIDSKKLIELHILWQNRFEDNVVRPVARAAIRDAVSQFGVEEIVSSKRAELEKMISEDIRQGLELNNLQMTDFLLRNIRFSDQYAAAVEQKQVAEQQAQQAKLVVEQKKQEAEQARQVAQGQADAVVIAAKGAAEARLIQADAEAKANNLIAASLAGRPELLTWLYITKLAPNIQVMLLPSNAPFLFPLPDVVTQ